MRTRIVVALVVILGVAAMAWAAIEGWDWDAAKRAAGTSGTAMAIKVDQHGACVEVEYQVPGSLYSHPVAQGGVPLAVRTQMNTLYPGATVCGIAKVNRNGTVFWELATTVGTTTHVVRFANAGSPEFFEIPVASVPTNVTAGLHAFAPGTKTCLTWKKIVHGADIAGPVSEYHARFCMGGKMRKVALDALGAPIGVGEWYEIQTELEVPAR